MVLPALVVIVAEALVALTDVPSRVKTNPTGTLANVATAVIFAATVIFTVLPVISISWVVAVRVTACVAAGAYIGNI
jgi:hypothetical protein